MRGTILLVLVMTLMEFHAGGQEVGPASPRPAPFSEQIVFLYYSDLRVAEEFFGKALGLEKTMDKDWVKIYRTIGGSSVGAVKEGRGFHKPAPSKPVMITWAVNDLDAWYARVVRAGITVLKEPRASSDPPAKTFLVADPTGYTFEFLQWLDPHVRRPEL
jgi:predicted enzyme related to lactoylglutathione lyase